LSQGRLRIDLDPQVEEDIWKRHEKKETIREIARAVGESTWVVWTRLKELKSQREHVQSSEATSESSEEVAGDESPSESSKHTGEVETEDENKGTQGPWEPDWRLLARVEHERLLKERLDEIFQSPREMYGPALPRRSELENAGEMIYAATQEKMAETARELEKITKQRQEATRKQAKELMEKMCEQLRNKLEAQRSRTTQSTRK
jgi:hypothetical protein